MNESTNESRLQPIVWLSEKHGVDIDVNALADQEKHAQSDNVINIVPTIGCEVEVKWSSLFPEIAKEYFGEPDERGVFPLKYSDLSCEDQERFDEICRRHDEIIKPRYEETVIAGIPAGADAYWEFANRPTYSWKTLAAEVSLLIQNGYIPEGSEHSLHVTLGGVSPKGGGVCLLLSGLELLYVPAGRIEDVLTPSKYGTNLSWARRGNEGIRQRYAGELLLGQSVASEMRTLTVSTAEQIVNTLRTAQTLGSILLSHRLRNDSQNEIVAQLSPLWNEFRSVLHELWHEKDLPLESWGTPRLHPETWRLWADSLRRRSIEDSVESHTIERINSIVDFAHSVIQPLQS